MCLDTITKRWAKPSPRTVVAYKAFEIRGEELRYMLFSSREVIRGKWIRAEMQALATEDGDAYESGFHCLTNRRELEKSISEFHAKHTEWFASKYRVVRVKVRGITVEGKQLDWRKKPMRCIVAREMYVPKGRA